MICAVATGNEHKLREIREILSPVMPEVEFVSAQSIAPYEEPPEDGEVFIDNARIKVMGALENTPAEMAIADDSGLMVDALNGEPGVYSARWAGEHGDDGANNVKLLTELEDVPEGERTARFCSVIVLRYADGREFVGKGYCEGRIGFEPRGEYGFGYDPLFLPDAAEGRTMAQLTPEEKNLISHRFHALQDLAAHMEDAR